MTSNSDIKDNISNVTLLDRAIRNDIFDSCIEDHTRAVINNREAGAICAVRNDAILGDEGDDVISGTEKRETIYGGKGNDSISGGKGDDSISGNDGDDVISGHEGNDCKYAAPFYGAHMTAVFAAGYLIVVCDFELCSAICGRYNK